MVNCPNCGATMAEGASVCENCGASMGENGPQGQQPPRRQNQQQPPRGQGRQGQNQQPPQGGQGQQPPRGQQGQQPPQGGQGQQPPRGQQRQPPQGGQGQGPGGQPPGGPGGAYGGGDDNSRREFLKYGAGAAILAGGGYFAWTTFMGPSGPAGKVRSFYSALNNGNLQKAQGMIHPQSPMKGSFEASGSGGEMLSSAEINVQSTDVVSETETRATVKTKVKVSLGGFGEETSTGNVELRKHNGEWMLYSESTL